MTGSLVACPKLPEGVDLSLMEKCDVEPCGH